MNKYTVTFVQYYDYEVDANNMQDAKVKAYRQFIDDVSSPTANCGYDEVIVERCEEDD